MKKMPKTLPFLEFRRQGVFAAEKIKKGELLECSPVIPIQPSEWKSVSYTVLRHYAFAWGEDNRDAAIALGYGSFFNSSPEQPTAYYVNNIKDLVIEFFAVRDIEKGEEITVKRRNREGLNLQARRNIMIFIGNCLNKGRGVFARRKINGGELIESAPVLLVPSDECSYLKNTILENYCFRCGPNQEHAAIAMGYGSLYNHSYTPNAVYEVKDEEMAVQFRALKEIQAGEEITVNYNRDPGDRSAVWFEVLP